MAALRRVVPGTFMQLIPVIDVLRGIAVHARGGRRENYLPLVSRWTQARDPIEVMAALHAAYGFQEFYVADLDAIQRNGLPSEWFSRDIGRLPWRVWLDAGLRSSEDCGGLGEVACLVAGLETLDSAAELSRIVLHARVLRVPPSREVENVREREIVFSLDLRTGRPLRDWPNCRDALDLASRAVEAGVRSLLVLDLADVGMGLGTSTGHLVEQLIDRFPGVRVNVGGGVRDVDDLHSLRDMGVHATLLASALHNGRLLPEHLRYL